MSKKVWDTHASRLDSLAILAQEELPCDLIEGNIAHNGEVLVIEVLVKDDGLSLANRLQNEWLAVIVAICTDAEVNLLGMSVLVEGNRHAQDRILRGLLNVSPARGIRSARGSNCCLRRTAHRRAAEH